MPRCACSRKSGSRRRVRDVLVTYAFAETVLFGLNGHAQNRFAEPREPPSVLNRLLNGRYEYRVAIVSGLAEPNKILVQLLIQRFIVQRVRHLKATMHWTEMPVEFEKNLARYAQEGAIVFRGLDWGVIWFLLMIKAYGTLAKRVIVLEGSKTTEEIIALLKSRVARIPV